MPDRGIRNAYLRHGISDDHEPSGEVIIPLGDLARSRLPRPGVGVPRAKATRSIKTPAASVGSSTERILADRNCAALFARDSVIAAIAEKLANLLHAVAVHEPVQEPSHDSARDGG